MNWTPKRLVGKHTRGGQWVEINDQVTVHNDRRVLSITVGRGVSLELDVEDDALLIEELAEAALKVLAEVRLSEGRAA